MKSRDLGYKKRGEVMGSEDMTAFNQKQRWGKCLKTPFPIRQPMSFTFKTLPSRQKPCILRSKP